MSDSKTTTTAEQHVDEQTDVFGNPLSEYDDFDASEDEDGQMPRSPMRKFDSEDDVALSEDAKETAPVAEQKPRQRPPPQKRKTAPGGGNAGRQQNKRVRASAMRRVQRRDSAARHQHNGHNARRGPPQAVRTIEARYGEHVIHRRLLCRPGTAVVVRHSGGRLELDEVIIFNGAEFDCNMASAPRDFKLGKVVAGVDPHSNPPMSY